MYSGFKYETIPLEQIILDSRNPRIVTQAPLASQQAIIEYLFEYEDLGRFIKQISVQGKNVGAERPYVIKTGKNYTVVEGNNRIATYKLLTGLLTPPKTFASLIPSISSVFKNNLLTVDCSIAPDRDALLSVMAHSHFGAGDKSKWGYLGSRKAVYDEWKAGKKIPQLAAVFARTEGEIRQLVLEYLLYFSSISLKWKADEKNTLLNPAVEFNPPVRFLQTSGHKDKIGIRYDNANLKIVFEHSESKEKFKHLVRKLVISPQKGLGATASYDKVFSDYASSVSKTSNKKNDEPKQNKAGNSKAESPESGSPSGDMPPGKSEGSKVKAGSLFSYPVTVTNAVIAQLMKEAKDLDCSKFPGAGTFLLRNIVEALLKHIIDKYHANPEAKNLDLESSLNLCNTQQVKLSISDKSILKEFSKMHLSHLNLGAHANVVPNYTRLIMVRDCIDQFIKGNV